jgi:hypothetical protein
MTSLQDIRDACAHLPSGAELWADELVDVLAKKDHRKKYKGMGLNVKPWKLVGKTTKSMHRRYARDILKTISDFFQKKLDEGK